MNQDRNRQGEKGEEELRVQKLHCVKDTQSEAFEYPQPEQGIVVLHGILRAQFPQGGGQFFGGLPVVGFAFQQAEFPADPGRMDIERADQRSGLQLFPDTEVHTALVVAYHPAQEHVDPLGGGAFDRIRKMLVGAGRSGLFEKASAGAADGVAQRSIGVGRGK